jgi:hypothetical protein
MLLVRRIAKENVSLGVPITKELDKNYCFREIILKLKGSITISGGTTNGTPKDSNPLQLIKSIEVLRNGKDTLIKLPADYLHRLNHIWYGARPPISGLSSGDVQTDTSVYAEVRIPFLNLRGIKPIDTLLKAKGLSSLQLIIDIASSASVLVSGGDRTIAVGSTPFELEITTLEEVGIEDFVFGDMKKSLVASALVNASSTEFQIKPIPVGNEWKAFVIVACEDEIPKNTIINNIQLKSGSEVFYNISGEQLRYMNKAQFGLESMPDGYYVLDFMADGMLNQILDVRKGTGRETLEFVLDVNKLSGDTKIDVIGLEYLRPAVSLPAKK